MIIWSEGMVLILTFLKDLRGKILLIIQAQMKKGQTQIKFCLAKESVHQM